MELIYLYILLGAAAGMLAGMLGVGGGVVIVPGLIYIFIKQGFPIEYVTHLAIGTSLATILLTSISSIYIHNKKKSVLWCIFVRLAPGILIGSLLGGLFANYLRGQTLMVIFGFVLIILAQQMTVNKQLKSRDTLPCGYRMSIIGALIGWVSALVGIGGGSMTVPFLVRCKTSVQSAVATAAACGFPLAVAGMTGFIISGWGKADLPSWSTGYVYWPAGMGIVSASVITAILGANMAHALPANTIKKVFAVFLIIVGIKIVYSGITLGS